MSIRYNGPMYVSWRNNVYARDRYLCRICGRKGQMNAHHIKRKAYFPRLAYKMSNGITLCVQCHEIVTGNEGLFEQLFRKIVDKTLTTDFIYKFFHTLSSKYKHLVVRFVSAGRWLEIPKELIGNNKIQDNSISDEKAVRQKK